MKKKKERVNLIYFLFFSILFYLEFFVCSFCSNLFFFRFFFLSCQQFALLESVITSLSDEFAFVRRHRLKSVFAVGTICFLIGLSCVTRGGKFVFEILDYYGGGLPLVYIAVAECVAVMWIYGFKNFTYDIYYMLDRRTGWYWRLTWVWTSPFVLSFIAIYSLITHKPLKLGDYDFPWWADVAGWSITLFILLQIPIWAIYQIIKEKRGEGLIEVIIMLLLLPLLWWFSWINWSII